MTARCSDSDLNLDLSCGFEDSSVEINVEISNSVNSSPKAEAAPEKKACPKCNELILKQAKYCGHCNYFLVRS